MAGAHVAELRVQHSQIVPAADERPVMARSERRTEGRRRSGAVDAVDRHRLAVLGYFQRRFDGDAGDRTDERRRCRGDQDGAGCTARQVLGKREHVPGQRHRLRHLVRRLHHDRAGVYAQAERDRHTERRRPRGAQRGPLPAKCQCGEYRTFRMVLLSVRHAEHDAEAIARELQDVPVVGFDCAANRCVQFLEKCLLRLDIHTGDERERRHQRSAQHRDVSALGWRPERGFRLGRGRRAGGRQHGRILRADHRRHESIAVTVQRLDDLLRRSAVADRLADQREAARDGGVDDVDLRPGVREDLVPGGDAVAVLDQVEKNLVSLRLEAHECAVAVQLAPCGVQHTIAKRVAHRSSATVCQSRPQPL